MDDSRKLLSRSIKSLHDCTESCIQNKYMNYLEKNYGYYDNYENK